EREKGAIKDAAQAMAKGDIDGVKKAFDGLTNEQAKTVAAGLDRALRPGVAVNYDNDSKSIEFYTNPAKVGDGRSDKVMVPTDGGTPQKGKGDVVYDHDARPSNHEAGSKDLTNVTDTAKNADQERKRMAGLTMDMKVSAPAETIGLKFDSPEVKN